jgi:hypothetical protein
MRVIPSTAKRRLESKNLGIVRTSMEKWKAV